jgi:hypothetical protein
MITINGNFDVASHQKIDLVWINYLLKDLTSCNLYITLVARTEKSQTSVRKYKSDIFLWLVVPYSEYLLLKIQKQSSLTPCSTNSIVWSVTKNCWM